jgi:RHH-type transcriptional regulator, proline utilization regulon repressor / proline dehydrogenase / delta 1-pyrroline-5-carboxylate dehydrogenase
MIFDHSPPASDPARDAIRRATFAEESEAVEALAKEAQFSPDAVALIAAEARRLIEGMRARKPQGLDAFLHEYSLSSQEGVVLMCLAEALLRIPDDATRDRLIRDKLAGGDWESHLGHSQSVLVNASTWALMLTGQVLQADDAAHRDLAGFVRRLAGRSGEPVVRQALVQAMGILARQFVIGRSIEEALEHARPAALHGYRHSFDMLGEAALTADDADRYLTAYSKAIAAVGKAAAGQGPEAGPGISVKLSALHPRYQYGQHSRVMAELVPRLHRLAEEAAAVGIALCVDAEEADRLELSLDVIAAMLERLPAGWDGFGLAVQAYQKRAPSVIDWLGERACALRRRLQVRLVKGAYWDSEIKRAQEGGLPGFPVYTRKVATDVAYLACAKRLAAVEWIYPQFATHNAQTAAAVRHIVGRRRDFEFQRLHGMGEALHDQLVDAGLPSRIYGPVGSQALLLPYLVRRLLENGANASFVNRLADAEAAIEDLIADPVTAWRTLAVKPHPAIVAPARLFAPERANSAGLDLGDPLTLAPLAEALADAASHSWGAAPTIAGRVRGGEARAVVDPADHGREVGVVVDADAELVAEAVATAYGAAAEWNRLPADRRGAILEAAADLFEQARPELMALAVREAGKTIPNALGEVREAVDFLRYYAARARAQFAPEGLALPSPTGESNRPLLSGRGVFACISPWNFPLAIFTGQVAAALAAGNAVIAKPAEQTPLIAAHAVRLLHQAGIPVEALGLLPGDGRVGAQLVADRRVAGVAFTGSTETAQAIHQTLAARGGPIVPLIAETGGQNAMIVDSTALAEQVVRDAVVSAFDSAGQRCSALRQLFVQEEVADRILAMLAGAMAELAVGDPGLLSTDIGPVIDDAAKAMLEEHALRMSAAARPLAAGKLPASAAAGTFFAPRLVEIDHPRRLEREVFGPFLHVVRYRSDRLDQVLEAITATGYGLTLGIHSRVDATIRHIAERACVGNVYVNRGMIGAVVGSQPFGGEGLSGTGPKAGGPHYLLHFATERCVSVNTAAAGGNASLLTLG